MASPHMLIIKKQHIYVFPIHNKTKLNLGKAVSIIHMNDIRTYESSQGTEHYIQPNNMHCVLYTVYFKVYILNRKMYT